MNEATKQLELTEEQLDMVAGGIASNYINQCNVNNGGNIYNTALLASNVHQSGSSSNTALNASDRVEAHDSLTKTWATLFSHNSPY
jgi:hypothetical protein